MHGFYAYYYILVSIIQLLLFMNLEKFLWKISKNYLSKYMHMYVYLNGCTQMHSLQIKVICYLTNSNNNN